GKGRFPRITARLILIALAATVIAHHAWPADSVPVSSTNERIEASRAQPYSADLLAELLRGDRPVFVNMTADWCITCKVNERVALTSAAGREVFAQNNVAYLKGDWTNEDPAITRYL